MKSIRFEMDMCNGSLLGKIIVFTIPLILSGVLQLLFNAADIVVVGRFAGSHSLAAVGSTSSLINLLVNVFIGLSIGCNVLVARYYGGHNESDIEETVHTSILIALLSGFILVVIGLGLSHFLLELMGTPEDVIDLSVLYMRIYFLGMPASLVYNFGSAILRAVGDTLRPLLYLFFAGIVNVVFNLIFVIVFHMGVAGVALATIMSQFISAILVVWCLIHSDTAYRLDLRRLRLVRDKVKAIARIGLPAGLQGAVFSVSNVLIQSSVNSFGAIAIAGNTVSANIEGFVYTSMNAVYQTAINFTSQNFGARNFPRIRKVLFICMGLVIVVGVVFGSGAVLIGDRLIGFYDTNPEVIRYGMERLKIIASLYFLCGMMEVMVGLLRGIGYSVMPMMVSLTGACAFRVLWIFAVFSRYRSLETLYISYPISWVLTFSAHLICFLIVFKKARGKE